VSAITIMFYLTQTKIQSVRSIINPYLHLPTGTPDSIPILAKFWTLIWNRIIWLEQVIVCFPLGFSSRTIQMTPKYIGPVGSPTALLKID